MPLTRELIGEQHKMNTNRIIVKSVLAAAVSVALSSTVNAQTNADADDIEQIEVVLRWS